MATDTDAKATARNKERQANLNAASGQASKRLKEAHLDEWNGYMVEETEARGEKWAPKPDEEAKALGELEALLKAHPELAEKVPDILGQPTLPTDDSDRTSDLAGESVI